MKKKKKYCSNPVGQYFVRALDARVSALGSFWFNQIKYIIIQMHISTKISTEYSR